LNFRSTGGLRKANVSRIRTRETAQISG
jgi:hypothetical protein